MGQRENEVEVAGAEQFLGTRGEPLVAGISLTLRTMPIPTRNGELPITCIGLNRFAVYS